MADEADTAAERTEVYTSAAIQAARRPIALGVPGECSECLEQMPRLVNGRCAPCRDGRVNPKALV